MFCGRLEKLKDVFFISEKDSVYLFLTNPTVATYLVYCEFVIQQHIAPDLLCDVVGLVFPLVGGNNLWHGKL